MAELFHNLALGFGVAISPINLMLCLIGALVGTRRKTCAGRF